MQGNLTEEARRQLQICNACRYCENFCSVFPAVHSQRRFADEHINMLADLCHNCRGCYYACQYVEPHEFSVNIPAILAEIRTANQQELALPSGFARAFHTSGTLITLAILLGLAVFITIISLLSPPSGIGFYGVLSHNAMIALFTPAFILPLILVGVSLKRYWRSLGGGNIQIPHLKNAVSAILDMRNLAGGHGDGCNFEDEDKFTHSRRWLHQATMYGFLLCFAATCSATLMHYFFNLPAPYAFWSIPKLLGVVGGLLLCAGTAGLAALKLKADPDLGAIQVWNGDMAFILLLFVVSASGLALYWGGDSTWLTELLALHLGAVLAFFLLMPYTKMVHGFYRLTALIKNASKETP